MWNRNFISAVVCIIILAGAAQADTNLIAHYTFDEGSGSSVGDSSGNGYNGTVQSGTTWESGHVGSGALSFDGTDDYVELDPQAVSQVGNQISVAFWINAGPDSDNGEHHYLLGSYINSGSVTNMYRVFILNKNSNVQWVAGKENIQYSPAGESEYKGQWNHWAMTKDVSTSTMKIYLNGQLVSSSTSSNNSLSNVDILRLGCSGEGGMYYQGIVDDLRIYNKVLSDTEIGVLAGTITETYTISGNVGIDGVTMTGLPGEPVTSSGGYYSATVDSGWSGTVVPVMGGYTFNPPEIVYSDVTYDFPNQYYAATESETDTSLVGWWKFDEISGDTLVDSSGYGNDGTIINATRGQDANGGYLEFDGVDDYVELGPGAVSTITDQITIAFEQYGGGSIDNGDNSYLLGSYINDGGITNMYRVIMLNGSNNVQWVAGRENIQYSPAASSEYKDQWNHWVMTKDVSTGQMKIYLNGELVQSDTRTNSLSGVDQLRLGATGDVPSDFYEGKIDDLRIYNRVLSEAEIQILGGFDPVCEPGGGDLNGDCVVDLLDLSELADMWLLSDYSVTASEPAEDRLQVFYAFDETQGSVAYDFSGHQRDASADANGTGQIWNDYGVSGGCFVADGNSFAVLPEGAFEDVNNGMTISVWLNTCDNVLTSTDFKAGGTDPNQWDQVSWNPEYLMDTNDIWIHYAYVKNPEDGTMSIYHDGLLVGHNKEAMESIDGSQADICYLGAGPESGESFVGKIDNFKIYDYPLSHSEVLYLARGEDSEVFQEIKPLLTKFDYFEDGIINMRDFSILAGEWLDSPFLY